MDFNGLCVVDVETTGLDPILHDVISICILPVGLDLTPSEDVPVFEMRIRPEKPENATKKALEINGEDLEDLMATAPTRKEFLAEFNTWFDEYISGKIQPLGHNYAGFDKPFIMNLLDPKHKVPNAIGLYFHYHCRDTMVIAQYINDRARYKDPDASLPFPRTYLGALAKSFNIPHEAHKARGDCEATLAVYRELVRT